LSFPITNLTCGCSHTLAALASASCTSIHMSIRPHVTYKVGVVDREGQVRLAFLRRAFVQVTVTDAQIKRPDAIVYVEYHNALGTARVCSTDYYSFVSRSGRTTHTLTRLASDSLSSAKLFFNCSNIACDPFFFASVRWRVTPAILALQRVCSMLQ
jgi:hypothetical protein